MKERLVKGKLNYVHRAVYMQNILRKFVDYLNRALNIGINQPQETRVWCSKVYLAQAEGIVITASQSNAHSNQLEIAVNSLTCPGLADRITTKGLVEAFPDFDFKNV